MNKYETMFIIKPDLSEDEKKALFAQISDTVTKHNGEVQSGNIWSEKRRLYFPIKKHHEGVYYLLSFNISSSAIKDIRHVYGLNENILRFLISRL